jgi:hypothetical protein
MKTEGCVWAFDLGKGWIAETTLRPFVPCSAFRSYAGTHRRPLWPVSP